MSFKLCFLKAWVECGLRTVDEMQHMDVKKSFFSLEILPCGHDFVASAIHQHSILQVGVSWQSIVVEFSLFFSHILGFWHLTSWDCSHHAVYKLTWFTWVNKIVLGSTLDRDLICINSKFFTYFCHNSAVEMKKCMQLKTMHTRSLIWKIGPICSGQQFTLL